MAQIILKRPQVSATTHTGARFHAPQPIIIDFSKSPQRGHLFHRVWIILLAALATLFLASFIALLVLTHQVMGLWSSLPQPAAIQVPVTTEAPALAAAPSAAFTPPIGANLLPLAAKELVLDTPSTDFKARKALNDDARALVPMLEKLPLYEKQKSLSADLLEPAPSSPSAAVLADEALDTGDFPRAIRLYTRAIKQNPQDETSRNNLVALLLDEAGSLDEAGETSRALSAYKRVLGFVKDDPALKASIRERMGYLFDNNG